MVTQGAREEHWREERWAGLARSQPHASSPSALLPKRQHIQQQQHLCRNSSAPRAGIILQPQEMTFQPPFPCSSCPKAEV